MDDVEVEISADNINEVLDTMNDNLHTILNESGSIPHQQCYEDIRKTTTDIEWNQAIYKKLYVIVDQLTIAASFYDRAATRCIIGSYVLGMISIIAGALTIVCAVSSLVTIDDKDVARSFLGISIFASVLAFLVSRLSDLMNLSDKANTNNIVSSMYNMLNHEIALMLVLPTIKRGDANAFMVRIIFSLNIIDRMKYSAIWNRLDTSEKILSHHMISLSRKNIKREEKEKRSEA
jgi:hypothetical protein